MIIDPYRHFKGLLDTTSIFPVIAFSVRRLKNSYKGDAIRVRRSSDNAEIDIGFDIFGNLNTTLLASFVGSGSGYITKWYDQTGNAKHAIQDTSTFQPIIVNAGTIETKNSYASIKFSGAQYIVTGAKTLELANNGTDVTLSLVLIGDSNSNNITFAPIPSDGDAQRLLAHIPWSDGNTYFDIGTWNAGGRLNTSGLSWTDLSIGLFRRSGSDMAFWKNSIIKASNGGAGSSITESRDFVIGGGYSDGSYSHNGYMSEFMVFNTGLDTSTDKITIENSQSSYFGITLA